MNEQLSLDIAGIENEPLTDRQTDRQTDMESAPED